ncbi:flippase [Stutzerimonas chloritidismutans]|uniref:flippase n=1 Tax=Stutzerimonas chloritidismutans TaxID=203192 RepID=UPI00384B4659
MKRYIQNSAWLLLEKITKLAVAFVLIGLVANQLGPEGFGVLSLGLSVAAIIWAMGNLGLDQILIKEFAQENYSDTELLSTAVVCRFAASVLIVAPCFIWIYHATALPTEHKLAYAITIGSVLFYNFNSYQALYQAKSRSSHIAFIGLSSLCVSSLIKITLLWNESGLILFSISAAFDIAINLVLYTLYQTNEPVRVRLSAFNAALLGELWRPALPMLLCSLMIVVYTRVDQLMIASLIGIDQAGIYSVAIRVVEAYAVVPMLIATAFFPFICSKPDADNVRTYFDIVMFSSVVAAAAVWIAAQIAIPFLFGPEYIPALDILGVSMLAAVFSVVGFACTNYLVAVSLGHLRPIRLALGLMLNIGLNLVLIPRFGLWGAATATLISQVFASWIGNALSVRTFECLRMQSWSIATLGLPGISRVVRDLMRERVDTSGAPSQRGRSA